MEGVGIGVEHKVLTGILPSITRAFLPPSPALDFDWDHLLG